MLNQRNYKQRAVIQKIFFLWLFRGDLTLNVFLTLLKFGKAELNQRKLDLTNFLFLLIYTSSLLGFLNFDLRCETLLVFLNVLLNNCIELCL